MKGAPELDRHEDLKKGNVNWGKDDTPTYPLEGGPFLKAIHMGAQIFIEQPGINNTQIMYFNNPNLHTNNFT